MIARAVSALANTTFSTATHLIVYGLAFALPLLLVFGASLFRAVSLERAQIENQIRQTASGLVNDLDRDLDRRIITLRTLATSPALADGDVAGFHAQAKAAVEDWGVGIFLVNPTSLQVELSTLVPYGAPLPQTGNPGTVGRVRATKLAEVSDLFFGATSKRLVFDVAIPILRDGELRHILSVALTPSVVLALLDDLKHAPGWVGTIWNHSGTIIARSRDHEHYAGSVVPSRLRADGAEVLQTTTSTASGFFRQSQRPRISRGPRPSPCQQPTWSRTCAPRYGSGEQRHLRAPPSP